MPSIYDLFNIDPDEKEAIDYASRLTPAEALMAERRNYQQGAVRATEDVGRAALGLPQSQNQHREMAGRELRELAAKVAPGTVEFYAQAAAIFRKHGLVAEAEQMQKNLHALEIGKGETDPVLKMQRVYDELKKRQDAGDASVQPAMEALARRIKAAGTVKPSAANDPEFIKLLDAYESALEAGQSDRAATIKTAIDAWIKNKAKTGGDMTPYQEATLALRKRALVNAEGKETRKVDAADAAIISSLQAVVRALDDEIQSANALLTHPGTTKITGSKYGAVPLTGLGVISADAANAGAFYRTLEGQVFIRALQDLKATSKTGASGLGQLTEVEGNKIQAAKAALHRQQETPQFLTVLRSYTGALKTARAAAEKELTGKKAEVPAAPAPLIPTDHRVDPRATSTPAPKAKPKFKATRVD